MYSSFVRPTWTLIIVVESSLKRQTRNIFVFPNIIASLFLLCGIIRIAVSGEKIQGGDDKRAILIKLKINRF